MSLSSSAQLLRLHQQLTLSCLLHLPKNHASRTDRVAALFSGCRDAWPPSHPTNVETIAASFVPPTGNNASAVRMFNLAMDVPTASLSAGGHTLATNVQYSLGSPWAPVLAIQQTFSAADESGAAIASAPFTPPNAPGEVHIHCPHRPHPLQAQRCYTYAIACQA